jgi:peptidoglycan/LPS O-acetylase OafA/YrhL
LDSLTLNYPQAAPGRVPVLDELRGLAILLVVTYHTCGVTGFPNYEHGELGVDIFILLSGAALTLTNRPEEGAGRFLWRRLARLLPAYWIALTIFWLAGVHLLGRVHKPVEVIAHYLCIHPWWGDQYLLSINDSFWFLGLVVPLYIAFAFLRRFLSRLDLLVGLGLVLSFALVCWIFFHLGMPALFVQVGLRPPIFFVGVILGTLLRDGVARIPLTPWLGVGVLLTFYGMFVNGTLVGYTVAGFSVFALYLAARANAAAAGRRFLCRGLSWLGIYSYEIFLLHQPLIREYNDYVWRRCLGHAPSAVQTALGAGAGLLASIILAFLLHHLAGFIGRRLSPSTRAA